MPGCPIMGLPVGFNDAGLPMCMQLIGPHREDLAVLRMAHAYDEATAWPRRRAPLVD
jgi:amidase